jgi:hypothetical protein
MPYKLVSAFCFIAPLVGLVAIEMGARLSEFSWGYPNGSAAAFASYCVVVAASIYFMNRHRMFVRVGAFPVRSDAFELRAIYGRALVALLPLTAFVVFGIGGYEAIVGRVQSGEFRASLGGGGAAGYLILKYYAPAILAYTLLVTRRSGASFFSLRMIAIAVLCGLVALSFGFKSGIVLMLLPAAILIFWNASLRRMILLGGFALSLIILGYLTLGRTEGAKDLLGQLLTRLFVFQADLTWSIWGQFKAGVEFPNYWNTLLPILGDRVFSSITGITRAEPLEWVNAHFNLMATSVSGYPPEAIIATGHNGSATAFSEGLIAGGVAGVLVIAVFAGAVLTALYMIIDNLIRSNHFAIASVAACYFVMGVMAWLLGGGIAELVHVSIFFAVVTSLPLLWWISRGVRGIYEDVSMLRSRVKQSNTA